MLSMVPMSSSMLSASWMTPEPTNGIITGYTIRCSAPLGMLMQFIIDGSMTTTVLSGLAPFTEYMCFISANTSVGEGDRSDNQTAMTDEAGKRVRKSGL